MFELVDPKSREKINAAQLLSNAGLAAFQEVGVIVYRKVGEDFSRVDGVFALPMYSGGLAVEELTKIKGSKDDYSGVYTMVTKTSKGSGYPEVAATGTVTITLMDPDAPHDVDGVCNAAIWILWDFVPETWLCDANGYAATGTRLKYLGVGIEIAGKDGPRLAAAWSNNMFMRTWTYKGQEMTQYGVCGSAAPAPKAG